MFEIIVRCPDLALLAAAIEKHNASIPQSQPAPALPQNQPLSAPPPPAPVPVTGAPVQTAVATTPNPNYTPAPTVPVSAAPTYTLGQLAKAGAELAQGGKMPQVMALLQQYGIQAVTQLSPEHYGAFATALRGLGAQL